MVWEPTGNEFTSGTAVLERLKEWVMLDIYLVGIGVLL